MSKTYTRTCSDEPRSCRGQAILNVVGTACVTNLGLIVRKDTRYREEQLRRRRPLGL